MSECYLKFKKNNSNNNNNIDKNKQTNKQQHKEKTTNNKFSILNEGLPSLKTACAHCMLGTPPNLVVFYTTLNPCIDEHQQ